MKIIHIAGWSGSGKTTFIKNLVKALSSLGKVGTVKHIGDHVCDLPAGKDTTVHYEAGVFITAGIDQEKTMITCRSVSLPDSLNILADSGVQFAVVEGFKDVPFKKVVIGDLNKPALIRNPSVEEVISILTAFDDYYTLSGLIHEIGDTKDHDTLFSTVGVYENDTGIGDDCRLLEDEISRWNGISGVMVRFNPPVLNVPGQYFVVLRAAGSDIGSQALARCSEVFSGNTRKDRKSGGRSIS